MPFTAAYLFDEDYNNVYRGDLFSHPRVEVRRMGEPTQSPYKMQTDEALRSLGRLIDGQ